MFVYVNFNKPINLILMKNREEEESESVDRKIEVLIRQRETENRAFEKILEKIKEQLDNEKLKMNDEADDNENSK